LVVVSKYIFPFPEIRPELDVLVSTPYEVSANGATPIADLTPPASVISPVENGAPNSIVT
jgi:hypothetical protein